MGKLIDNPRLAAWVSTALAAPLVLVVLVAGFGLEPLASFLRDLSTRPDGVQTPAGLSLMLVLLALLLAGLAISAASARATVRSGRGLASNSVNVFLATAIGAFVIVIGVGIAAASFPHG